MHIIIILICVILFAGTVTVFIMMWNHVTRNSYVKNMIKSNQIHITFPDPVECMTELGYWSNGSSDTPESKAAMSMYCLVKEKFNTYMKIN